MQTGLAGKVIWVIGATGALGRETVAVLREEGAIPLSSARGQSNRDRVPGEEPPLIDLPVDLQDTASVEQALAQIIAERGRVDGMVCFAAAPAFGEFLDLSDDDWFLVWNTKMMGSVRAARAVLPTMIKQGGGSIVLVSGRGGMIAPPNHLPGASANAALNLLAQGLATRYGRDGVRVNALSPGPIRSARMDALVAQGAASTSALGRPGSARDVANAALFLLSDAAAHITGINMVVDGGR